MNFVKMNVVDILQIIVSTVIVIIGSCVDLIQSHFCIIAISGCKIYKELIALFSISCCDFLMYSMRLFDAIICEMDCIFICFVTVIID